MPWLAASVRDAERKDQKIISSMNLMWFSWEERRGEECDRLRRGRSRALPSRTFLSFSFPSAFRGTGHLSVRVDGSQGRTGGGDEAMGRSGPGEDSSRFRSNLFQVYGRVKRGVEERGVGGCPGPAPSTSAPVRFPKGDPQGLDLSQRAFCTRSSRPIPVCRKTGAFKGGRRTPEAVGAGVSSPTDLRSLSGNGISAPGLLP